MITKNDIEFSHSKMTVSQDLRHLEGQQRELYIGHAMDACKSSLINYVKDKACNVFINQDDAGNATIYAACGFLSYDKEEVKEVISDKVEIDSLKSLLSVAAATLESWNSLYPNAYWELKSYTERLVKEIKDAAKPSE